MKVTGEMVDRAASRLVDFVRPCGKRAVRCALEAALVDVPEPETVADGYAHLLRDERARARALEAKLRRVESLPDRWEARAVEQTKETAEVFGPQSLVMSAVLEQLVRGVAAELREALKESP